jgi:LysR family glycine cleavage system transcriptional activator
MSKLGKNAPGNDGELNEKSGGAEREGQATGGRNPASRRLPPLNSLKAFEAAARHLSIANAAKELNVTPAAVSHHIRQLEEHLGLELFQRNGRQLDLTDAGRAALPGVRDGFAKLMGAMDAIDQLGETGVLNVSVAPSFAAKWLLPRLGGFQEAHPEIDVHVAASLDLADFARDGVDLAIRYGAGLYPALTVERLMQESIAVVCSPSLLPEGRRSLTIGDVQSHTLLHDDSPDNDASCPNWDMWLRAAGAGGVDASRGQRFNQSSLVLEAAVRGRGIALAKAALAAEDLAAGRLVLAYRETTPVEFAYFIVTTRAKLNLPKVAHFRSWLVEEASRQLSPRVR